MNRYIGASRRRIVATIIVLAAVAVSLPAQSVGGGISVFLPLSMVTEDEGSVGFETSLETSLGLGDILSLPIGIAYNQVWGLDASGGNPAASETIEPSGPWFYSDSFLTYLMAKAHLPLGSLYFDLFGGVAMNWNIALRPFGDRIGQDLLDSGFLPGAGTGATSASATDVEITDGSLGWGYVAGGGIGVQIGAIGVDLNATYRHVRHNLTLSGEWYDDTGASGTFDTDDFEEFTVHLQGFSVGISGSYAM